MSAAEIAESHPAHVRLLVEGHGLRGHAGNRRNARRHREDEPWGRFGWVDEDVKWFKIVKD